MGLTIGQQARYWGIAAIAFLVLMWLLSDVLLPFAVGAVIAYLLNPVADRLEAWGLPRLIATTLIAVVFVALFGLAGIIVIPVMVTQAAQLVASTPEIFHNLQVFLGERFPGALDANGPVRQTLAQIGDTIRQQGAVLIQTAITSVRGVVGAVLFLVVMPVVAFYLLWDWNRLVAQVDGLLPREHADTLRRLARGIDAAVAGFIRGQLTVCLILAAYYAIALTAAGLSYGIVIGVVTGLISFIPYIGAIIGGALAIGLALWQFWGDWLWVLVIVAIFALGQFLEGNVLVPRMVGGAVGLHPVWLLFALSAFGALFGFAGVLLAVPVAAALGVVVRFGVERYRDSALYRGDEAGAPAQAGVMPGPLDGAPGRIRKPE